MTWTSKAACFRSRISCTRRLHLSQDRQGPQNRQADRQGGRGAQASREASLDECKRVDGLWQDHGLVFTTQVDTPINRRNFYARNFKPILEKAGLPTPYTFTTSGTRAPPCF
jgi:hypothetical protein